MTEVPSPKRRPEACTKVQTSMDFGAPPVGRRSAMPLIARDGQSPAKVIIARLMPPVTNRPSYATPPLPPANLMRARMTITHQDELDGLKAIGRIVANTMHSMAKAMEPGMTTRELDALGHALLEREGAVSAPQSTYCFPGTTCISVNEEIAHGIPGDRKLAPGDLVNIDVSASLNGYFADTGATFGMGPVPPSLDRLCRDGKRAMDIGIAQVGHGKPLAAIGNAIGAFASKRGYTLIQNLASHGVGKALHEYPQEVATWPTRGDKRRMHDGLVLTVEPFLSRGGRWATSGDKDNWTLYCKPKAPVVQYEHTVVATRRGPVIVTLPG
jgi:methionyl aminopeptidase